MTKVKLLIVGAGNRGFIYAGYALKYPELVEIVGVAEPRNEYRTLFIETYKIKKEYVFNSWQEAVEKDKFADAVVIATQDREHTEPVIAFAKKNYHILLEKPIAVTKEECIKIYDAVKDRPLFFGVCHVLRYTPYTKKIKSIIDSGTIGDVINIQRVEPVGYWHYAHSYVRGNWRNEEKSSFMLLAKCCHDIDWIHYIMNKKCIAVSSFGALNYFKKEHQPENASEKCIECKAETNCPYSAKKIYFKFFSENNYEWPLNVITTDFSEKGITKALEEGPYGKCVFTSDNDVVDNQVVNLEFENGCTASLTMIAFSEKGARRTTIFGTKGEIRGSEEEIEVYDFLTDEKNIYKVSEGGDNFSSGHGGGDFALMEHFIKAIIKNDKSIILSGPEETLESHLLAFYAEQSRKEKRIIKIV